MSRLRLFSAASDEFRPLANVTEPTKTAYAQRWGHEAVFEVHSPERISWQRVDFWRKHLPGSGFLWATGADVAITNVEIDVFQTIIDDDHDIFICIDGNGLQADSFILRECSDSLRFLADVAALEGIAAHEQDAATFVMAGVLNGDRSKITTFQDGTRDGWYPTPEFTARCQEEFSRSPLRVKLVSQRLLNAYPAHLYDGHGITGNEEWCWHPSDLACHLVARSLEFRVAMFKKILGIS